MEVDALFFTLGINADTTKLKAFATALQRVENTNAGQVLETVSGAAISVSHSANDAEQKIKRLGDASEKAGDKAKKSIEKTGNALDETKNKIDFLNGLVTFYIGLATGLSVGIIHSFNGILGKIDEYSKAQNKLFNITKDDIKQSKEYTKTIEKTGQMMDSLKVRVSLGLLPTLSTLVASFNDLLANNRELISDGLIAFFRIIVSIVKTILDFVGAINNVISNTIGWKAAILALIIVLGILKKAQLAAFATNPVTLAVLAVVALIALVDDLITYLNGGKSAFGEFWKPAVEFAMDFWQTCKEIFDALKTALNEAVAFFKAAFDRIAGLFDEAADRINGWIDAFEEKFGEVYDIIVRVFKDAFAFVENLFDKTIGKITSGIQSIGKFLGLTESEGKTSGAELSSAVGATSAAAIGAQSSSSQTINQRGGNVKADITVISPDPVQAGNKVRESLAPAYARASQNMQSSRAL
jgi:hypothetical protein